MAVDYLSAMNVGSGLNVTQIVDALVDAEKAPQEASINKKVEEKTVSISSFSQVKQELSSFGDNLELLADFSGLVVQSSGTSILPTVKDKSKVIPSDHVLSVSQLARPQTIAFTGYTSETAAIDATSINIDIGNWNNDGSFSANAGQTTSSITLTNTDTLADVRDKINNLNVGLTAAIIRTSDSNFALTVRSPMGATNQMRFQTVSTAPPAVSVLSYDPATNSSDASKQAAAGRDAIFTVDGVSVTRPTNIIDDVISGVSLNLKSVSLGPETISTSYNEELTLEAVQLFVDELNTIAQSLKELGKTGTTEENSGPLAGDTIVRSLRSQLRMITTTPISGFGDSDIFLSNFGVMTNLDGTLSIDKVKFKSYFATNPSDFAALANSRVSTNSLSVQAKMTGTSYTPGVYRFVKNSDSTATIYNYIKNNDGSVSLGTGTSMSLENGIYKTTTGGAVGVHITADGTTADSKVYIGKSLFETLQDFTKSVLRVNSDIDQKVSRYSDDIKTYNEQLEDLNAKMETQRDLYVQRFTAMETAVASFKETGTLLDNFMEAWRAGLS